MRELWLHLYLNAFKNERSAFLRERVGGRGSSTPETGADRRAQARARATRTAADVGSLAGRRAASPRRRGRDRRARPAAPRRGARRDASRSTSRSTTGSRRSSSAPATADSFHMVGQWFPKIARLEPDGTWAHFPFHHLAEFYADFGTYDVTSTCPRRYAIGATGPVVEAHVADGRRIERHVQGDVHDFAWTAWDRWQTCARDHRRRRRERPLSRRASSASPQRGARRVRFALPYYSARYGRYPYTVLTVVHPQDDAGEAGGMEYPTLITTGGPWLTPPRDPDSGDRDHPRARPSVVLRSGRAPTRLAWPFLDEGLNQFAEVGRNGQVARRGIRRGPPRSARERRCDPGGRQATWPCTTSRSRSPRTRSRPARTTAGLVYSRTAAVMETLARVYGDDAVGAALGRVRAALSLRAPGPGAAPRRLRGGAGARAATLAPRSSTRAGWTTSRRRSTKGRRRDVRPDGSATIVGR